MAERTVQFNEVISTEASELLRFFSTAMFCPEVWKPSWFRLQHIMQVWLRSPVSSLRPPTLSERGHQSTNVKSKIHGCIACCSVLKAAAAEGCEVVPARFCLSPSCRPFLLYTQGWTTVSA